MFMPIEEIYKQEEGKFFSKEPEFVIQRVGENIEISMRSTNFNIHYERNTSPSVWLSISLVDNCGREDQSHERMRSIGKMLIAIADECDKQHKEAWKDYK